MDENKINFIKAEGFFFIFFKISESKPTLLFNFKLYRMSPFTNPQLLIYKLKVMIWILDPNIYL